jgi:hypothetical protein
MGDEKPGAVRFLTDFSAGSRIAGYCLEEQIGHGGTAVVFRAQDERLPRQVALKILSPTLAADDEFRHRFIRESRSAAAVDDPHIIPVYEAGDANGVLFIAMRYVPSGDAGTLVRRLGPLPIARVAAIISAVASALDAAHAVGLVHRDVKPANMLVDSRPGRPDHVYLSDFGQTRTGHFLGTPTYCAPEQIRGQSVDARTDEYALACAAFMLLSGEPPFLRDEGLAVLYAHMSEPPPRLTSRRQDLPVAVDDVLLRALAKTPEDRYLTCGEFADDLRAASGLQRYDSDVAVVLHQRALTDQQRKLGLDHADALIVRFSIAREMAAHGDHAGAEKELRAVLPHLERRLGRNHPDALATRFGIAREMAARGDHAGAEEQYREVFAARQQALGPDHPHTLGTRLSIAREMAARGDHAGAEAEYQGLLPHLRRRLGPDHPNTLTLWFSLAQEMTERGDHAGAAKEFRDMLPYLRRKLGPDHPNTLAAAELINNIEGNRSPELRQLIAADAQIENDDTAVAKMPGTENRPAEPTLSSGDHVAGSGEPPRPGEASRTPGSEPGRYLVGEMQSRVRAGTEVSLIVSITTESPEPGLAVAPLPGLLPGPQGVQVTFVVRPDAGLLALGELQQAVTVPPHGDSQPVRFAFRARAVGLSRIRLTAWLGGTFLGELRLDVSVESEQPMTDNQRRSTPIGAMQADPGEVTLQVHTDGARYSFQLLSQKYLFGPVVAKSLTEEPGQAVERTVAMLRKMAGDISWYTPALAARWVRETGTGLWHDLVPKSIQDQYWQLRDSITSFTIACEDDTVPWELLYPLTPTDDAGFLVEQFPVLRRIYDQCRTHRVLVGGARYVVPPGSPANALDEVDAISRILGQPADSTITNLGDLLDLLDAGSTGLLHFACHNTFALEAGGSAIKMAGGALVPQLLNSAVGRRCLAARSPLIFVNACRSAGVSAEYTQMMGWASQFMAAGAGAFLGTLWPVRSSRASMFAEAFYAALVAGADLGRASLAARQATKDDADPTWLAYTVYGDPAALGVSQY